MPFPYKCALRCVCFRRGVDCQTNANVPFQQRREPIATDRPTVPFLIPSVLPLDIVVVGPPKSPRNSFAVANMTLNKLGNCCCAAEGEEEEEEEERRPTDVKEEKQEEMIIVSSGTHITPGHTAECGAMTTVAA